MLHLFSVKHHVKVAPSRAGLQVKSTYYFAFAAAAAAAEIRSKTALHHSKPFQREENDYRRKNQKKGMWVSMEFVFLASDKYRQHIS